MKVGSWRRAPFTWGSPTPADTEATLLKKTKKERRRLGVSAASSAGVVCDVGVRHKTTEQDACYAAAPKSTTVMPLQQLPLRYVW